MTGARSQSTRIRKRIRDQAATRAVTPAPESARLA